VLLLKLPGMLLLLLLQAVVAMLLLLLLRAVEAMLLMLLSGCPGQQRQGFGSSTGKLLQQLQGYLEHAQLSGAALVVPSARRHGSSISTVPARACHGGAGGSKLCKVCTIVKYRLNSVSQVGSVPEPVPMTKGHQTKCPYCKCQGCKQQLKVKLSSQPGSQGLMALQGRSPTGTCT